MITRLRMLSTAELMELAKLGAAARLAQIEQERARMVEILNDPTATRQKRRATRHHTLTAKAKLHWTQRPENKKRLQAMARRAAKTRLSKKKEE